MLQWFLDIFQDTASQARLVTVVITAIIAISVVLLNQWIISKREARDLYNQKIERLYLATGEFIKAINRQRNSIIAKETSKLDEEIAHIISTYEDMKMIQSLYFSELSKYDGQFMTFFTWVIGLTKNDVSQDDELKKYQVATIRLELFAIDLKLICVLIASNDINSYKVKEKGEQMKTSISREVEE